MQFSGGIYNTAAARRSTRPLARSRWSRTLRWANFDIPIAIVGGLGLGAIVLVSPVLAVVAAAAAVVGLVAFLRPISLGYLMIAITALTGGTERDRFIPILTPNEVGLVLMVGLLAPAFLVVRSRVRNPEINVVSFAFVILVFGTVIVPVADFSLRGIPLDLDNAFKLIGPVQYFLLFWAFTRLANSDTDRRNLVLFMMSCGSIVALVGLAQAARLPPVIWLLNNYFSSLHLADSLEGDAGRITSLIGAWNALGMFMMASIILSWAFLPELSERWHRIIAITCLVSCSTTLIASGSFSGLIGAVVGVAIVSYLDHRLAHIIPLAVAGLSTIGAVFFFGRGFLLPVVEERIVFQYSNGEGLVPRTLADRFDIWRDVFLPPIRENFPRAVYPKVPQNFAWLFEESQYIMLLFRTGLAGFLAHILWVGIMGYWILRRMRHGDDLTRRLAICALAILVVLSLGGFTNSVFSYSGSVDYMWILFALVASTGVTEIRR